MKNYQLSLLIGLLFSITGFAASEVEDSQGHVLVADDGSTLSLDDKLSIDFISSFEGTGDQLENSVLEKSVEEVWSLLELETLNGRVGIESIIGTDDRKKVSNTTSFPYRAIALVRNSKGRCTGWLIGPDTVATAGHCVHSGGPGGNWYSGFRVYPGRDGRSSPFGSCTAKRLYSVNGWLKSRKEEYDYGLIKLNCKIGNKVGWLGFFYQNGSLNGLPTELAGYPGDKPLEMWTAKDKVRATSARQVFYQADTVGGNSGGPVFYNRPKCGSCSMAFHAYGLHGASPHRNNNHGTRITSPVFKNMIAVRNAK